MNGEFSGDFERLGNQILHGGLQGAALDAQVRLRLMRLPALGPRAAFDGLLEWIRLGLTLRAVPGPVGIRGARLLGVIRGSPLARRIMARHNRHERGRQERLSKFEQRRAPRLSAAVETQTARTRAPGRDGSVRVGQIFDRFSLDRHRSGRGL
jgi:hypothetical protein